MPIRASKALCLVALVSAVAAASCSGSVGSAPGSGNPGGSNDSKGGGSKPPAGQGNPGAGNDPGGSGLPGDPMMPTMTPPAAPPSNDRAGACKTFDPGLSPLRLMTRSEYDATVRDLLGETKSLTAEFPEDGRPPRGFANDTNARSASDKLVGGYMAVAEKLAANAVAQLPKLLDCDVASKGETACLQQFLAGFGKRAWRRPLTASETQDLTAAFTQLRGPTFASGIEAVTTIMLMSPQFLYRYEQGIPVDGRPNIVKLTSYEVAARLSYLLWGTMPDNDLFAAADADELSKPEQVLAQARRMTNDPRYLATVTNFTEQLLDLDTLDDIDKDAMTLPAWKPELRQTMRFETDKLLEQVLSKDGDGKIGTLLTASYSFVNGPLAGYYGLTGPAGDAFTKVDLDAKASGFLTQAGFLAAHGNPDNGLTSLVFRGKFVRENLLCQAIPDPPPNAQDDNPPFTPTTTAREWSMLRSAKPVCGSCHQIMDPIGFGFENYDPIGKYRTVDRGKPVDASGKITATDIDGDFTGVPELGKKLAGSQMVKDCVAVQWFRFASGRSEDQTNPSRDACTLETMKKTFSAAGGDLRELFLAYTQTDGFLFRSKGDDK
jgi:hypothetical protein